MNFLAIVKLVITLLPTLIEAIKAIEAALPQSGAGAEKLGLLRAIMQNSYDVAGQGEVAFEKLWPAIANSVGSVVQLFNKLGTFRSKNVPPQPDQAAVETTQQ